MEELRAFAFLTCEPNPLVGAVHPKTMPVILHPEDYDSWLDGEVEDACALAQPFPSQLMRVTGPLRARYPREADFLTSLIGVLSFASPRLGVASTRTRTT